MEKDPVSIDKGKEELEVKDYFPLKPLAENSGLLSIVKTVSYSLLTFVKSTSSPRLTPEEVQELNKSRGYDQLKYEIGTPCGAEDSGSWLTLQI